MSNLAAHAVMAGTSLAAACGLYLGLLAGAGFPDGHLTDYERWAAPFVWSAVSALLLLTVGALVSAITRTTPIPTRWLRWWLLVVVVVTVATVVVLPVLGQRVLQLEHGQGG